jgi:hypothetical protein
LLQCFYAGHGNVFRAGTLYKQVDFMEDPTMKCFRSQLVLTCGLILLLSTVQAALGVQSDDCANAPVIGEVTDMAFDTRGTTSDGSTWYVDGSNIWYRYIPSCTGEATVSLVGSDFDTNLAIYNGVSCYPGPGDLIESNDNYNLRLQSQITFTAIAGYEYLIEIGGQDSAQEEGILNITCGGQTGPTPPSPWPPSPWPPGPSVSNDDYSDAHSVGDVSALSFDTGNATFDGPGLCMTSANVWYCYTASCTGNVIVSLLGSSYDTMLAVYDRCSYPASNKLIECNDDAIGGTHSQITFAAVAGHQYLIEVGGYGSETGEGVLSISCGGQPSPWPHPKASNDDCQDARSLGDVTGLDFDTSEATFDGQGLCMTGPNLWYCYTASCTGEITVSLSGSDYDTMLALYDGCSCYLTSHDLIDCDDDSGSGTTSEITFAAIAGRQYLIEVGGYGSETGQGVLSIRCYGPATQGKSDLGDAPDSSNNFGNSMTAYPKGASTGPRAHYPTVFNDGSGFGPYGPVHLNSLAVAYLGQNITRESEADTGFDTDGGNNIRPLANRPDQDGGDDGVVFPLNLPNCGWGTIDYYVTVTSPGADLWVNIWLDFNRDGDWDDTLTCPRGPATEWAVKNQFLFNLPAGLNRITTPAILSSHPKSSPADIWMRITLSEQPWRGGSSPGQLGNGGSGPRAKYQIGETEDYYFSPKTTAVTGCELCEDFNGDGVIDIDDLAAFTTEWLTTCP